MLPKPHPGRAPGLPKATERAGGSTRGSGCPAGDCTATSANHCRAPRPLAPRRPAGGGHGPPAPAGRVFSHGLELHLTGDRVDARRHVDLGPDAHPLLDLLLQLVGQIRVVVQVAAGILPALARAGRPRR